MTVHGAEMSSTAAHQPQAFSERLRAASRHVHSTSDALVNAKLLVAFTRVDRYGLALSYFEPVFSAIEKHCEMQASSPALAPMAALLPRISRTDAFDADLKCLLGCDPAVLAHVHTQPDCVSADWLCDQASGIWHCRPNWRGKCKPPLATLEYIRYLDTIAHEQPMLLLAHLYTQESALLAGGQMIRRMARKAMQLPDGRGTNVFDFPEEESVTQLRKLWKQTVNETAEHLTPEQQAQLVQEHCKVFAFNNAIVGSFRVSFLDWPLAIFRTMRLLPFRIKILLGLLFMLCVWLTTRLGSLLRSM